MAQLLAAFGGTFTGVFSALLTAKCPVEYAAKKAWELAENVDADFNDPMGVVTPVSAEKVGDLFVVSYQSRSGKAYAFSFSNDWYSNSVEFDADSSLSETFNSIIELNKKSEETAEANRLLRVSDRHRNRSSSVS